MSDSTTAALAAQTESATQPMNNENDPAPKPRRRRKPRAEKAAAAETPAPAAEEAAHQTIDETAPAAEPGEPGAEGGEPRKKRRRRRRGRGGRAEGEAGAPEATPAEAEAPKPPKAKRELPPMDPAAAKEIFAQETTFADLGLREEVLKGITEAGFVHPTGIQAALIPVALKGRDILGQAKTGTGKTAAFGLPLFNLVERGKPAQALVLAPTRELAIQIAGELEELGRHTGVRVAPIYGGQAIHTQAGKLRREPEIIVGTPGRIMDMVDRRLLRLDGIRFAVLDEVDRMLDIGFREDIRKILGMCPEERQTIFVSATISEDIEKLARRYMRDPEKVVVTTKSLTVSLVKQHYLSVQPYEKKRLLKHLLTKEEPALTVVFCRTKRTCDDVAKYLTDKGIDAHAIHGDLPQGKRNSIMQRLRSGQLEVLIASDLASRGIDVEGITHVINYDLPEDVDLYVHRIGRTARAGRGGVAWSFVTPDQGELLTQIELLINAEIPKLDYPDFVPGPMPESVRLRMEERKRREEEAGKAATRYAVPAPAPAATAAAVDASKFPGGIVPTKLPPRLMHGKVRAARR